MLDWQSVKHYIFVCGEGVSIENLANLEYNEISYIFVSRFIVESG
jgi:hypothetical protein